MQALYGRNANVFKAFCDEKRLRVLDILKSGEKCACVLMEAVDMPQSTLSYHMKVLCESGVVKARQDGKWTHYRISARGTREAMELLQEITRCQESDTDRMAVCPAID